MSFSPDKCKVLSKRKHQIKLNGTNLEKTNLINYLGVYLNTEFNRIMQPMANKIRITWFSSKLAWSTHMSPYEKIKALKIVINSVWEYALVSTHVTESEKRIINRTINKIARSILGLPRYSPSLELNWEIGLPSFDLQYEKSHLSFAIRLAETERKDSIVQDIIKERLIERNGPIQDGSTELKKSNPFYLRLEKAAMNWNMPEALNCAKDRDFPTDGLRLKMKSRMKELMEEESEKILNE